MKKLFGVLAVAGLALTLLLPRASAVTYTLAELEGFGAGGVTVGALTFNNFNVGATGAGGFDPTLQSITFTQEGACVTLTYNAGFLTSGTSNAVNDLGFTYNVQGPGINYASASGIFNNVGPANTGNASDVVASVLTNLVNTTDGIKDLSTFLVTQGDGSSASLTSASASFSPQYSIVVVQKDLLQQLTFAGGASDFRLAAVSNYQQSFCYVPEPGTVAMFLGLGVSSTLFVVARRRRK